MTEEPPQSAADDVLTPPYCNTGVENTWVSGHKIDWLEFTLFNWPLTAEEIQGRNAPLNAYEKARIEYGLDDLDALRPGAQKWTVEEAQGLAGLDYLTLAAMPRGIHGYRKWHQAGPAQFWSEGHTGKEDMGVHVVLGSDALSLCRRTPEKIIRGVLGGLGKFTRVDLALDDFAGALDLKKMIEYSRTGRCISRADEGSVWESFRLSTGETTGLTHYIGSRESDHYFRIYDKRLERIKAGQDPATLPAHWVRIEAELKGPAAEKVSRLLYAGRDAGQATRAILNNYFRFADPKGANRSRWPVAPWWSDFLDTADRLSVAREVKPSDLDKRRKWFAVQAAPSMAMLMEADGPDEMLEVYKYAARNLKDGQKAEVAKHKDRRKARRDQLTEPQPMESPSCQTRV